MSSNPLAPNMHHFPKGGYDVFLAPPFLKGGKKIEILFCMQIDCIKVSSKLSKQVTEQPNRTEK